MKLEYAWYVGDRNENNIRVAPITVSKDELQSMVEQSQSGDCTWYHKIGLVFTQVDVVKRCMEDSYRTRENMFMFREYLPFCKAVIAWLEQNVKQSVSLSTRVPMNMDTQSSEVLRMRVSLKTPYISNTVSLHRPYKRVDHVQWSMYEYGKHRGWENTTFRGDWVGLVKSVCERLSRLELMQESVPPTSLHDLLSK